MVAAPGGVPRAADGLLETAALAEAARALRGGREAAHLAVLLLVRADPAQLRVAADGAVERIHHDHLEELVGRILAHPVRAEHAQRAARAPHSRLHIKLPVWIRNFIDCTHSEGKNTANEQV